MKEKRTGELVGSVIGGIIGLLLVNSVLLWLRYTRGVVLDTWGQILWASNLSFVAQIVGNLILSFYRPARMYSFVRLAITGLGLLSMIVFSIVFPMDFGAVGVAWLNTALRVFIWIGMAGGAVGAIVWFARFIGGAPYQARKAS
jgi:hypothetical protein